MPAEAFGLPAAGSQVIAATADWAASDTPGFLVRSLVEAPGLKTRLMRVEAGAHAASHSHDAIEIVYVLDGQLYDDAGDHHAGDCIVRAAGAAHVAGSREGATLLLVYAGGDA